VETEAQKRRSAEVQTRNDVLARFGPPSFISNAENCIKRYLNKSP
jgi:hypothetical protein